MTDFTCRGKPLIPEPPTPYRLSGAALRALRLSKGITLERAARRLGAVRLMVGLSEIERGSQSQSAVLSDKQLRDYLDWLNSLPDVPSTRIPKQIAKETK